MKALGEAQVYFNPTSPWLILKLRILLCFDGTAELQQYIVLYVQQGMWVV